MKARGVLAVALGVLLSMGAAEPASAGSLDWSRVPVTAASVKVIEVVDAIPGNKWNVRAAVKWMDVGVGSRMKVVSRKCSATAYRCIRIQDGGVAGPIGRSRGAVITIDTQRAARDYGRYYSKGKNRTWLLAHEIGHQLGLRHSAGANVMNEAVNRYAMRLTAGQRAHLRGV